MSDVVIITKCSSFRGSIIQRMGLECVFFNARAFKILNYGGWGKYSGHHAGHRMMSLPKKRGNYMFFFCRGWWCVPEFTLFFFLSFTESPPPQRENTTYRHRGRSFGQLAWPDSGSLTFSPPPPRFSPSDISARTFSPNDNFTHKQFSSMHLFHAQFFLSKQI
jgi:hypothetical protein